MALLLCLWKQNSTLPGTFSPHPACRHSRVTCFESSLLDHAHSGSSYITAWWYVFNLCILDHTHTKIMSRAKSRCWNTKNWRLIRLNVQSTHSKTWLLLTALLSWLSVLICGRSCSSVSNEQQWLVEGRRQLDRASTFESFQGCEPGRFTVKPVQRLFCFFYNLMI